MKPILISAGHSNVDPGACAYGLREADIAVEMRNIVSFYLSRMGLPHDMDGKGTANMPLKEAAKKARAINGIEVEFHCNASDNISASGSEVLAGPANMKLAGLLSAAVALALGVKNRGAKPQDSGQHSRLAFVQAGGMIVELFFITNRTDIERWQAKKWLVGKAVADVLARAARG